MKLYSRTGSGAVLFWGVVMKPEEFELEIRYGQIDGLHQIKTVNVDENQSGRGIFEQCELEMNQRIARKKQQGYTEEIPEVGAKITNALGLPKPMLARKYIGQRFDTGPGTMYTQPKLDGNRCIIKLGIDGSVTPYTRNGKEILTLSHITDELNKIKHTVTEDTFLDGELYCHGESLQTIISWVKRKQDNTSKIKFMVYDMVSPYIYNIRFHWLGEFLDDCENIEIVKTMEHNYIDKEVAIDMMMQYREQGYEGAIIRCGDKGYEDGKRSASLLKVKHWEDDEFRIIDVVLSKDGHGIFVCEITWGDTIKSFRCTPPGDFDFRYYVADNPAEFIGKFVTVEYANLTKEHIPFHPIAKCMVEHKEV